MENTIRMTVKDRGNSVDRKYRYGVQSPDEHTQFLFLGESYEEALRFSQAYREGWTHAIASMKAAK